MTARGDHSDPSAPFVMEILPTSFAYEAMQPGVRVSIGSGDADDVDGSTGNWLPATASCRGGHLRLRNSRIPRI
jgi:hypothetical protein